MTGDNRDANTPASPACALHELDGLGVDPAYLGFAGREELIALFNQALAVAGGDNPQISAVLAHEIEQLGGTAQPAPRVADRLAALTQLRADLPRVADTALKTRLSGLIERLEGRR